MKRIGATTLKTAVGTPLLEVIYFADGTVLLRRLTANVSARVEHVLHMVITAGVR